MNLKAKLTTTLLIFNLWLAPSIASAYYFAYVPDLSGERLHIINTSANVPLIVTSVPIFGNPRDVLVNHAGTFVYVTSVVEDSNVTDSYISQLNTATNANPRFLKVGFDEVRGMAISKNDQVLYITHRDGVRKMSGPFVQNDIQDLETTYSGGSMALSSDDKILFIVGSDANFNSGISVVNTESFTEITTYSLGTGKNSSAIALTSSNDKLFIANRDSDEIVALNILNYDDASALELETIEALQLPTRSSPTALVLSQDDSELYVALSYVVDEVGTGDGSVIILTTDDINQRIENIEIADEESSFSQDEGVVHPGSLAIREDGSVFLLKRIWSDKAGLYLSELYEYYGAKSGNRYIEESNSLLISNSGSLFSNGKFIGPDCDTCPSGIEAIQVPTERPAALNPLYLLFFVIVIVFRKRLYLHNETHNSRSRRCYQSRF